MSLSPAPRETQLQRMSLSLASFVRQLQRIRLSSATQVTQLQRQLQSNSLSSALRVIECEPFDKPKGSKCDRTEKKAWCVRSEPKAQASDGVESNEHSVSF